VYYSKFLIFYIEASIIVMQSAKIKKIAFFTRYARMFTIMLLFSHLPLVVIRFVLPHVGGITIEVS
jgi:hypothetical protein